MTTTVPTNITIWQDLNGDQQWRVEFIEEAPGTRQLQFGPFDHPVTAREFTALSVTVPLPDPSQWDRNTVEGLREEFSCHIENEVPA